jgi:hypothetical protein
VNFDETAGFIAGSVGADNLARATALRAVAEMEKAKALHKIAHLLEVAISIWIEKK